ncbi:hypothetical protein CerSpe_260530 [Prunus speciosa]
MNSYGNAAVIFDDSGSDDENCEFDVEEDYKGQAFSLKFSSPGENSSLIPLDNLMLGALNKGVMKYNISPFPN